MPSWLAKRRGRREDEADSNGGEPDVDLDGSLSFEDLLGELRQHLQFCQCSLVGAWAVLLDEVEGARRPAGPPPSPAPEAGSSSPTPNGARLVDAYVTITDDGEASADVWLDLHGQALHGHGAGATSLGGRHVAMARATVDALKPAIGSDASLESMVVHANQPESDRIRVVVTVAAGGGQWAGTAAAEPEGEEWGAALAVLNAVGTLHNDGSNPLN